MKDEQELTDELEEICGGPEETFRLMGVYITAERSFQAQTRTLFGAKSNLASTFRQQAQKQGFTDEQITAFLNWQLILA